MSPARAGSGRRPSVALLDYGAGNLHSLRKGLEAGGAEVRLVAHAEEALSLDALVLPGVGSFGTAVAALDGWERRIRSALRDGLPCLGICLGMQLLFPESEEGTGAGIGLVEGHVRRLRAERVPQMGWNDVVPGHDPLFERLSGADADAPRDAGFTAYYANTYVCEPADPALTIATSRLEGEAFTAALRVGRTVGVQFHPEKSSTAGLRVLRNFLEGL